MSRPAALETENPYRLPRTVVPSRYDLVLEPDLASATFAGSEDVVIAVHEPVDEIVLNSVDVEIDRGWVEGDGVRVDVTGVRVDTETERAHLSLAGTIEPGERRLHLEFRGVLNDGLKGFYRSTYTDDEGATHVIATTQFEATDARRAFPCWDEPDLKAVFGVTLVVGDGLVAVSNGPEVSREATGDGRFRVRFADTMVMSTYLVAFVVGRLEITGPVDVDGVPLRIVHVPGKAHLATFALDAGAFCLRFFADYYGIAYPDRKVDFVALPDFAAGAMENLGCITYREHLVLVDPEKATAQELMNVADVVAHELAHMWFGDLVTMRWWNGIWLNEAFATFMEVLAVDAYRPDWQRWSLFARSRTAALDVDALGSTRPIEYPVASPDDASGMFDTLTYSKGGAVLRMLEQYLGSERFRAGIRRYLERHAHGNTETHDLWDAIEEVTGEPVRRIMDGWIWQGGYPLIASDLRDGRIRLDQGRFRYSKDADDTRWEVPLVVRTFDGSGSRQEPVLLPPAGTVVALEPPGATVIPNTDGNAFVRVRLSEELLARITRDLGGLSAVERYHLVDDTWAAVLAGVTPAAEFVRLAEAFRGETDLPIWQALLGGLGWCDRFLAGEPRERFRALVRGLVRPPLDRIEWEARPDDADLTKALRGTLFAGLGVLGADPEARALARKVEAEARVGDRVDPALAAAALNILAVFGAGDDFEAFLEREDSAQTPQERLRYLYSLPEFREAALMDRLLELTVSERVRPQDAPFVLARAIANRDQGERAWPFVKAHWDDITGRFARTTMIFVAEGVRFLATPELADDAEAFFTEHPIAQSALQLSQVLERQRVNAALRLRIEPELASLFS